MQAMARHATLGLALVSVVLATATLRGGGGGCTLGGQPWADLPMVNFTALVVLDGRPDATYVWAYRPCSPAGLCPNDGYIQQMLSTAGLCYARWDIVNASFSSAAATTVLIDGNFHYNAWATRATVTIACDPQAGFSLVDDNHGKVNATTLAPSQYAYQFNFRSACACGRGCALPAL
eukprot:TRINITY_DN13769_c0_g1_i1.p2 TRINITY_DN13769_c0_g1~~TRINITY_DN13769_c0_g1_i1.p2  ORF type:complete len:177 (-),score=23.28 TRINITY_DN13769_c0_g1_i1:54-584(-)